jgi:hypothetical protein
MLHLRQLRGDTAPSFGLGRRGRNLVLLEQPNLNTESRLLAQNRIAECDRVLASLDEEPGRAEQDQSL